MALAGAVLLLGASAAEAGPGIAIKSTGANKFTISLNNTKSAAINGISVGPSDTVNGNAVTGLNFAGQPSCQDAMTQKAWICFGANVPPGATATGTGTTQMNLVQGSENKDKVCTTTDGFVTATCLDVVEKPPPVTAHLTVVKVATVLDPGMDFLSFRGGDPLSPDSSERYKPLARAVAVGGSVEYTIHVRNDSGEAAPGISISDLLPDGCHAARGFLPSSGNGPVQSETTDIPPHGKLNYVIVCLKVSHDLDNAVQVQQDGKPVGVASAQHITVGVVPPAQIRQFDSRVVGGWTPGAIGKSSSVHEAVRVFPVTSVQVAVRRLGGHGCRWLSATGGFVKRAAHKGSCDVQVWLAAHGVKLWSLRFPRPLPPGRYLVEARTINHLGAVDDRFSTRAGTERTLTVH